MEAVRVLPRHFAPPPHHPTRVCVYLCVLCVIWQGAIQVSIPKIAVGSEGSVAYPDHPDICYDPPPLHFQVLPKPVSRSRSLSRSLLFARVVRSPSALASIL